LKARYSWKVIQINFYLHLVYCAYFHSSMNYDIIFWGNFPYSVNIFMLQKKTVRIITNTRNKDSYRYPFKPLNILPLQPQYVFLLLCFVVMNMDQYKVHSDIHTKDMRQILIFIGLHLNCHFIKAVPTAWALRFSVVLLSYKRFVP
jgi:hypothetical protein